VPDKNYRGNISEQIFPFYKLRKKNVAKQNNYCG